jgi:putative zinc finger/helix-turn-helix YgiT family protein
MKSPFTGGEATLQKEMRTMDFRKETFQVQFQYYLCKDSGEQFTDDELDEVNTNQVYNQYRAKYGIPFPDEIREIREQYGLPANKMAEILGLGVNVYRNYEAGEVPSVSNGRLIQMVKDPKEFRQLIDYSKNEFTPEELEKINKKINHALSKLEDFAINFETFIMLGEKRPSIMNGYRVPNIEKINNMVLYFAEKVKPFKTKLNKLLFYADFLHFKKTCFSISGLTYQAIQKGPVPKNYDWIFDNTMEKKLVKVLLHDYGNYMGEQFVIAEESVFDEELFTTSELNAMQIVAEAFKNDTVNGIVNKSHEEDAWSDNVESFNAISYDYGFTLKYPVNGN